MQQENGDWRWCDERRHRRERPPSVPEILKDKAREHGIGRVSEEIGLNRVTTLALIAEVGTTLNSLFVAQGRLGNLSRLDRIADDDEKEKQEAVAS